MKDWNISDLIFRYEQMLASGKSIYFDAGEFDSLAEYYDQIDDISQAKILIERGLHIHPENDLLLLKKAKFMIYDGLYYKAFEYLENKFKGYDEELYLLKIECLLKLEKYGEAHRLAEEMLNNEEKEKEYVLAELGFLYADVDLFDEAIDCFEKSLRYNSTNTDVLIELAYSYEMKNDFSSSIRINNKILDLDPYSYETWINIGKLHSLQDDFEKAIDAFDFAQTINEEETDVLKLKAHCLSLCGREEEAIKIFKNCVIKTPEDESLYYALSECYFSLEQYDNMLYYLDKYELLRGEDINIIAKRAIAYLQKGESDKSMYFIEKGMKIDSENDDLNMVTGELYFQRGDFQNAGIYFTKAYENNSENETLLDKLSIINIAKNDIIQAIKYLERLMEINPESGLKTRLCLMYFEIGNKLKFNECLNCFSDEELKYLLTFFYAENQFDMDRIDRKTLINRLNDARECRLLFKNIIY